jgi:hypothetical protein
MNRKEKLKNIAKGSQAKYLKYGDYKESDVHEGPATYGGSTYQDAPETSKTSYGIAVKRGYGKDAFIFQKQLYKINNPSGSSTSEVKV